ncbi:MAG TPA: alpha/beta fold hydrolase [Chthoniobacteraceae bacterium]|nr:alpha/beta fold hydrolase [Chthoniobacteraceae bacterium]
MPSHPQELVTPDRLRLYLEESTPDAPPPDGGTVVITHGLGEHSGRYPHVVAALREAGFTVITHDLRGHGRSGGRRGDAPRFAAFLDDLDLILRQLRPPAPVFLYGHSLGGLIALRYLQTRPAAIAGAVVASPWIRLAFTPPWWKLALGQVARIVFPRLRQFTGMNEGRLSRDPAFLATLPDLHLSHHHLSARLFFDILKACRAAQHDAPLTLRPLFLLHGQADPVTSWHATRELYEACRSEAKLLRLYPEALHETHNDLDRVAVVAEIVAWLVRQRAAATTDRGGSC